MARGWESKAVAEQMEEGEQAPPRNVPATHAEERQRIAALESLRLSRARLLEQLEKARHPAHREMLLKGLGSIEQQMEAISSESSSARTERNAST
jgi:hypothetical protein